MSTSGAYATATVRPKRIPRITGSNQIKRARYIEDKPMKLTIKQRIRNWLMRDDDDEAYVTRDIEPASLDSDGMRFQLYKAKGGFVIETRSYNRRNDENENHMYVITEDKDLGEELGKIITMESLR